MSDYRQRGREPHRQGGPRREGQDGATVELPQFNLSSKNAEVPVELYDETARKIAEALVDRPHRGNNANGVSRHQLRRLFDEVKRLKRRLDNRQGDSADQAWRETLPMVKLVKSKAAYIAARQKKDKYVGTHYENMKKFIDHGIDQIKSQDDLERFVTLFEAVYGFYYERGGSQTS